MTDDPTDRIVESVDRLNSNLVEMLKQTSVAADVRTKQLAQSKYMKIVAIVIAVMAFIGLLSTIFLGFRVAKSDDRSQCVAINTVNGNVTTLLRTYVSRTAAVPPGKDATQSEIDRYNAAVKNRDEFVRIVDETFRPISC